MAIVSGDIVYRMSGGAANADPNAAIGGAQSSNAFSANAIFDDLSSAEAAAGDTNYRCFFVRNTHATLTLQGAKAWIQTQTSSSDTDIAIGLDPAGVNAAAATPANEATAPAGVTFSSPSSFAAGLSLGDLAPGDAYPVWVRRTCNAGAAGATDTWTIRVQGDTNP